MGVIMDMLWYNRAHVTGMEHTEPRTCVLDLREAVGGQGPGGKRTSRIA